MTQPTQQDGQIGQILIKLGEIGVDVAVIKQQLSVLPDHEARLWALERFRWTITGASLLGGAAAGWATSLVFHAVH